MESAAPPPRPSAIHIWHRMQGPPLDARRRADGTDWEAGATQVSLRDDSRGGLAVDLVAVGVPLSCVALTWRHDLPAGFLVLGDAFERWPRPFIPLPTR
ncbi:hypothetical protein ACFOZ0_30465 [Streptomyces yaanensis]|uniref:PilZ domain-containing protein n=1 Tax=Streptomyces yaanensis TaxID=1142239 RepID=A0ABV7SKJ6_9ACTN|nr:hypothetical protein [Streptomyces sp. CGMCC 4.7035]WNC03362.1 hypothetical protein Q2K21_20945 [Streptomyces sp. CGMCC 4.7035]